MSDPRSLPVPVAWQKPIQAYLKHCASLGRSAETIRTYNERLSTFARAIRTPPSEVTYDQILEYLSDRQWSKATRYSRLQTWRGFWDWSKKHGLSVTNPTTGIPKVKLPEPNPNPLPYRLYLSTLVRASPRVRLILRLAGELGMRRGEIALVHSRDLLETDHGWKLTVHGKGAKLRNLPLTTELAYYLQQHAGYLLPGRINGHLSARRVGELANQLLPADWTLHKLRHMFASRSYAISRDLAAVQTLLGHTSPNTTRAYVQVEEFQLREIVESVAIHSFNAETDAHIRKREEELVTIDFTKVTADEATKLIAMLSMRIHTINKER